MSYKILDSALTRPIIATLFLFGFSALLTACASGYSGNISANTLQDTRANTHTEYSPSSADTTNSRLPDAHSKSFERRASRPVHRSTSRSSSAPSSELIWPPLNWLTTVRRPKVRNSSCLALHSVFVRPCSTLTLTD